MWTGGALTVNHWVDIVTGLSSILAWDFVAGGFALIGALSIAALSIRAAMSIMIRR